jgi:uncharacterized damage-inducible protein DinB
MFSLLRDMFDHQLWADAEHWRTMESSPAARDDETLRNRLHHIHLVQQSFMWTVGDRSTPFAMSNASDFPTFDALKSYARRVHDEIAQQFSMLTDDRLVEPVTIPWFTERALTISRAEALTQSVMHSQWHRGQNATRLRELGVAPPTIDLIVWYWVGKPRPLWDAS